MKGLCKIELRNADGNIAQQTEDKNMVTNYLKNLLNPSNDSITCFSRNYDLTRSAYTPLIDNVIGGILLFGETIKEDADYKIPKQVVLGHAASTYDGYNDLTLGVYNKNESGFLYDQSGNKKGWKYVWDFATDRANGTIKSVSLTTGIGGTTGSMGSKMDSKISPLSFFSSPGYVSSSGFFRYSLNAFEITTGNYLFSSKGTASNGIVYGNTIEIEQKNFSPKGEAIFIAKYNDNFITVVGKTTKSITLSKRIKKDKLKLNEVYVDFISNTIETERKTIVFDDSLYQNDEFIMDVYSFIVHHYSDEYLHFSYTSKEKIVIYNVDPNSLEIISKDTLNTNGLNYLYGQSDSLCQGAALYHGRYYIIRTKDYNDGTYRWRSEIVSVNKDDINDVTVIHQLATHQSKATIASCAFGIYDDCLFVTTISYGQIIIHDNRVIAKRHDAHFVEIPVHFDGLSFPYIARISSLYTYVNPGSDLRWMISNFTMPLITIDNLATPITKNSTQTMKITYEISDAE